MPSKTRIRSLAEQQQIALVDKVTVLQRDLVKAYRESHRAIQAELARYIEAAGDDPRKLIAARRLAALEKDVTGTLQRYGIKTQGATNEVLLGLPEGSQEDLRSHMRAAGLDVGSAFAQFPEGTIRELQRTLLVDAATVKGISAAAWKSISSTITRGVAVGWSMDKIARQLRDKDGIALSRALTIARTSVLQGNRQCDLAARLRNKKFIAGWVWKAALNETTCPICWALHGSEHEPGELQVDHPRGACTSIPMVKGAEDYARLQAGENLFDKLSDEEKRTALGPGRYKKYSAGTPLSKMFRKVPDERFGHRYELSPLTT